jgi:predicted aspartyl protease
MNLTLTYRAINSDTPAEIRLDVVLKYPDRSGQTIPQGATDKVVNSLLDTGSHVTFVPLSYLQAIKAPKTGFTDSLCFGNERARQYVYYHVKIEIAGRSNYVDVAAWSDEFVLLGRDVINLYVIELNGPDKTFTIFEPHISI